MTNTANGDSSADNINTRHQRRMERKKALMDERIQQAQRETGVLLVHIGNGKGKSSSAFGMVMRALGHGMQVGVVQFIKGAMSTGEEIFLRRFPDEVQFHAMGEGYTWETQNRERDIEKALLAWEQAKRFMQDPAIGLVVLDELNIALKYHYLDVQQVIADIDARPEMQIVKHAFKDGIVAQAGVEW